MNRFQYIYSHHKVTLVLILLSFSFAILASRSFVVISRFDDRILPILNHQETEILNKLKAQVELIESECLGASFEKLYVLKTTYNEYREQLPATFVLPNELEFPVSCSRLSFRP